MKRAAAVWWCDAVNADGGLGRWEYRRANPVGAVAGLIGPAVVIPG